MLYFTAQAISLAALCSVLAICLPQETYAKPLKQAEIQNSIVDYFLRKASVDELANELAADEEMAKENDLQRPLPKTTIDNHIPAVQYAAGLVSDVSRHLLPKGSLPGAWRQGTEEEPNLRQYQHSSSSGYSNLAQKKIQSDKWRPYIDYSSDGLSERHPEEHGISGRSLVSGDLIPRRKYWLSEKDVRDWSSPSLSELREIQDLLKTASLDGLNGKPRGRLTRSDVKPIERPRDHPRKQLPELSDESIWMKEFGRWKPESDVSKTAHLQEAERTHELMDSDSIPVKALIRDVESLAIPKPKMKEQQKVADETMSRSGIDAASKARTRAAPINHPTEDEIIQLITEMSNAKQKDVLQKRQALPLDQPRIGNEQGGKETGDDYADIKELAAMLASEAESDQKSSQEVTTAAEQKILDLDELANKVFECLKKKAGTKGMGSNGRTKNNAEPSEASPARPRKADMVYEDKPVENKNEKAENEDHIENLDQEKPDAIHPISSATSTKQAARSSTIDPDFIDQIEARVAELQARFKSKHDPSEMKKMARLRM